MEKCSSLSTKSERKRVRACACMYACACACMRVVRQCAWEYAPRTRRRSTPQGSPRPLAASLFQPQLREWGGEKISMSSGEGVRRLGIGAIFFCTFILLYYYTIILLYHYATIPLYHYPTILLRQPHPPRALTPPPPPQRSQPLPPSSAPFPSPSSVSEVVWVRRRR